MPFPSEMMVEMLRGDFQSMLEWQRLLRDAALTGHAVQQIEADMRFYMADVLKAVRQVDLATFLALDLRRTDLVTALLTLIRPVAIYESAAVPVA